MRGYFVGIGAQRCGTSWIADYLFAHPQVTPNPVKEMHVLDRWFARFRGRKLLHRHRELLGRALAQAPPDDASDMVRAFHERTLRARQEIFEMATAPNARASLALYRRYFQDRRLPRHAFGEVTPSYALLLPVGYRRVVKVFPSCRFFLVLRDPVDRLWSVVKQARWLPADLDDDDRFRRGMSDSRLLSRSQYELTLQALDESVDPDRVLILFYEDLFGPDHETTLRRLTDHLDLTYVPGDRGSRVGASRPGDLPDRAVAQVAGEVRAAYDAVEARLGRLPARWQHHRALIDS